MKKWIFLFLLISFVLAIAIVAINEFNKEEIQKLISQQTENCKLLKDQNKKLSLFLDKILSSLDKEQKLYQKAHLIHRFIQAIFAPLFEKEPETII